MEVRAPTYFSYDQHVRIVPMTRLGEIGQIPLAHGDTAQRLPGIDDILGRPPAVAPGGFAPLPYVPHAVLANAVNDVAVLLSEFTLHDQIGFHERRDRHLFLLMENLVIAAPVVFQVINPPLRISRGIERLVAPRSELACTCRRAR